MNVFDFTNYKDYLLKAFDPKQGGRGQRSALAKFLGCQTSFISQVLSSDSEFSLEHAIRISDFLSLDADQKHYFMLLVQQSRAGSKNLRDYYKGLIATIRKDRAKLRERIKVFDELGGEVRTTYYSMWWYCAVHILTAFPEFHTADAISKRLNLSLTTVNDTLDFLMKNGLVDEIEGQLKIGKGRIHLDADSPMITRHHINWRTKAITALERP